jgi:hypothetical protein
MGDYDVATDQIDFLNVTNNNDRDKVLATVGSTLFFSLIKNHWQWFMQKAVSNQEPDYIRLV